MISSRGPGQPRDAVFRGRRKLNILTQVTTGIRRLLRGRRTTKDASHCDSEMQELTVRKCEIDVVDGCNNVAYLQRCKQTYALFRRRLRECLCFGEKPRDSPVFECAKLGGTFIVSHLSQYRQRVRTSPLPFIICPPGLGVR
jgi:hypothetical protein